MTFIQQSFKGENKVWMFILTFFLVGGVFIGNLIFFLLFGDQFDFIEEQKKMMEIVNSKNFWLAVNLLPFVFLLGLLFLLVKYLHKRSILSLTTSRKKIDLKRVLFSFLLITTFTLLTFFISYYYDSSQIELQFDPLKFSILLIISLLLFPFQIGLEEYLFRGYLMQHIGFFSKNRWLPLVITSVLFGIFHSANPEVAEMGAIVMVFYIGTGLLLGIMTLMDEGLELALGFHFGNNLIAAILITSSWSALQTDAVFIDTSEKVSNSGLEILFPVLVIYPIFLLILARKYGWSNWKEKLFGKVIPPKENSILTE